MRLFELIIIAVGLSMDAFAVAVCKGLALRKITFGNALTVGVYFGAFQAIMPIAGFFIASLFAESIRRFDHWVAFALLVLIGSNMIRESLNRESCPNEPPKTVLRFSAMLILALATSIDALAVGVTFAFLKVNIAAAAAIIGVTTLLISMAGVKIGAVFGQRYKSKAEFAGGIILILMGLKILLEHLGVINF